MPEGQKFSDFPTIFDRLFRFYLCRQAPRNHADFGIGTLGWEPGLA
jgi:hypothetical protein